MMNGALRFWKLLASATHRILCVCVYESRVPKFEQIRLQTKKKQQEDQVFPVAKISWKLHEALRG